MTLSSLRVEDLAGLLRDMLRQPADRLLPLAAVLSDRTGGNPFFAVELVNALYREGRLLPDPERGQWQWDAAAIAAQPVSANVVDFLAARLGRLPAETRDALVAAACIGNTCDLATLSLATGDTPADLADRLTPALELAVIITPSAAAFGQADPTASLRFCHDRMAEAVYQLRDEAWRDRLHLAMARRFAGSAADPTHRYSAAEHYAAAASLLRAAAERPTARRLFVHAALRARRSGSFATAERFLRLGIELLPADAWEREQAAAFALWSDLHMALYSQSRLSEADEVFALLQARAASPAQLVDPTCVQLVSLSTRARHAAAVALGCEQLARLGVAVPLNDLPRAVEQALETLHQHLAHADLEPLSNCPDLGDETVRAAAQIMNRMIPAAIFDRSWLVHWLVLRSVLWWIDAGYSPLLLYPLAVLSTTTIRLRGDYATGYRAARVALETAVAREGGPETARVEHAFRRLFQPLVPPPGGEHPACPRRV
jgi:predicted ATPase